VAKSPHSITVFSAIILYAVWPAIAAIYFPPLE
jgi:hypothetical protein